LSVWVLATLTALACEGDARVVEVQESLAEARQRFRALDTAGFTASVLAARSQVPCLVEPMAPSAVADLHRMVGLLAFSEQDTQQAMLAFAAARAIEPETGFSVDLLPLSHPVREDYSAVDPTRLAVERVGEARDGTLRFDGRDGLLRPLERPTVVQLVGEQQRVLTGAYLAPGDEMPLYAARRARSPVEAPLAIATGLGLGLGAALLVGGAVSRASYDRLSTDTLAGQEALDSRRSLTNGLLTSGVATGALGLASGLGLSAVIAF
jgi:hypothetical protein